MYKLRTEVHTVAVDLSEDGLVSLILDLRPGRVRLRTTFVTDRHEPCTILVITVAVIVVVVALRLVLFVFSVLFSV